MDIENLPHPPLNWILETNYNGRFLGGLLPQDLEEYIFKLAGWLHLPTTFVRELECMFHNPKIMEIYRDKVSYRSYKNASKLKHYSISMGSDTKRKNEYLTEILHYKKKDNRRVKNMISKRYKIKKPLYWHSNMRDNRNVFGEFNLWNDGTSNLELRSKQHHIEEPHWSEIRAGYRPIELRNQLKKNRRKEEEIGGEYQLEYPTYKREDRCVSHFTNYLIYTISPNNNSLEDLKYLCKINNLKVSGNKWTLYRRLLKC